MKWNQREAVNHKIVMTLDNVLKRNQLIEAGAEKIAVNAIITR